MKYTIRRTSTWFDENPIVEGAYPYQIHLIERCKIANCPRHMLENCTNIRKEGEFWIGEVKKPEDVWVIDIDTLEELNSLVNTVNNEIIISKSDNTEGFMRLEVYDTYRE